jgi:formyl-CoA transferase
MDAHGAPYGITLTAYEAASHSHFQDRRMIADVPDPIAGSIRAVNSPLFFSDIQSEATEAAPLIGQHTEVVLHEIGVPDERIEKLISAHVIFQLPVIEPE